MTNKPLTDEEIEDMIEVARNATQKEWYQHKKQIRTSNKVEAPHQDNTICNVIGGSYGESIKSNRYKQGIAHAKHIATFDPPTVTKLLTELIELRKENSELDSTLKKTESVAGELVLELNARDEEMNEMDEEVKELKFEIETQPDLMKEIKRLNVELSELRELTRWRSVEEGLPKEKNQWGSCWWLIKVTTQIPERAMFYDGKWRHDLKGDPISGVTHWIPLSKLPEEK